MKRTPHLLVLAVFAVSVAMMAGSAMAQPGGGRGRGGPGGGGPGFGMRGPGGGGVMMLLMSEVVRSDVGIDDATAQKVRDMVRESMDSGRGDRSRFEGLRDMSEEERAKAFEEMRAEREKRTKEIEKKIAEIVGKDKFGRLKQIELQMAGVEALSRDEVATYLGLSKEQKDQIAAIFEKNREESRAKMQELMPGGFGAMRDMDENARNELMGKMRTAREESQQELQTKLKAVLTDEQKQKLHTMMGEPFAKMDEAREQMRAGFGGRGRGGPGGGNDGGNRGRRGGGGRRQNN